MSNQLASANPVNRADRWRLELPAGSPDDGSGDEPEREQSHEPTARALAVLILRDIDDKRELAAIEPQQLVVIAAVDIDAAEEHRLHRRTAHAANSGSRSSR